MVTTGHGTRRAEDTRELILTTAERLFAERGISAVSNRQVGEAAGQGNNFAVGYHFGSRTELVRAIIGRHSRAIEATRERMLARIEGSHDARDWVACLVWPFTDHLDRLGTPSWYARFSAQALTDPALRRIIMEDALTTEALRRIVEGFNRCLPTLPLPVHLERGVMARTLLSHLCAEREAALADGRPTPKATWDGAAAALVDAIVGLWHAPVTSATG
ncbi:TetR family transcriptional regulator [Actinoalloteichus sp. AHMU CJ021]|uniref:TetR/AcrR family transcriptional regulator n=1 Tax=Actinoalloteichus sp. AHMU CJ021 TaxID=2072503 RepID=UPI000CA075CC|nr:TetR family transcriptional regulator [Actinoalloteichus sp. AHMU CJ021]